MLCYYYYDTTQPHLALVFFLSLDGDDDNATVSSGFFVVASSFGFFFESFELLLLFTLVLFVVVVVVSTDLLTVVVEGVTFVVSTIFISTFFVDVGGGVVNDLSLTGDDGVVVLVGVDVAVGVLGVLTGDAARASFGSANISFTV